MKTKKGGYAKNKKVHRKENKNGTFTTINYAILRDKRLTPNAKVLLIEILSDTEGFKFSEQLYMNRMGITKPTLYRAMDKLIEYGYLKTTKIKNTHYNFYTISEYGNLNSNNDDEAIEDSTIEASKTLEENQKPNDLDLQSKVYSYLNPYCDFITPEAAAKYHTMADGGQDYHSIKSALDKILKKNQVEHFNEVKTTLLESYAGQKVKDEAIKVLKVEIFETLKRTDVNRIRKLAGININKRRKLDPESLQADKMDGM